MGSGSPQWDCSAGSSTTAMSRRGYYEAGGEGIETGRHMPRFGAGSPGVLHGARTYVMQDEWGQDASVALGVRRLGLSVSR